MIIQSYGKWYLSNVDWKMMTEYIHNTLIPELVKKEATTKVEFMKRYNLTKNCDTTVLKWMHVLGFWYERYNKTYYVDIHESPGTVRYRQNCIYQYLAMERRMHIWIQIQKWEKIELSITFPILSLGGYEYTDNNIKVMFEYHVDTIPEFQKIMADNVFGVNMSVTMGVGVWPLIAFG